jgi:hypothetical protein
MVNKQAEQLFANERAVFVPCPVLEKRHMFLEAP